MKMLSKKVIEITLIGILLVAILPFIAYAQEESNVVIKKFNIEDYPQVSIYLDFKEGSTLASQELEENDFAIFENGSKVENILADRVARIAEPIGVVLVIDTSGSMKGEPIGDAIEAASFFMDEMRSIDEFSVVGFADQVTTYSAFTSDRQKLKNSIAKIDASGETSMFDGIIIALNQFHERKDIKNGYLIVLSDGMDTISKLKAEDVIAKAQDEKVTIFSVALLSNDFNPIDIGNISGSTGGEMLVTKNSSELKELYEAISKKIRDQYKVTYTSQWPNVETIEVNVSINKTGESDSASTLYKNPYYAPPPTDFIKGPVMPIYLALFDIWWMNLIVYAAFFASATLFLFVFTMFIFPPRRILKQRIEFYGYKTKSKNLEDEIREKKGKVGFFDRIVILVSKLATKRGFVDLFDMKLERAGMNIRSSEFISIHIIAVSVCSLGIYLLTRNVLFALLVSFIVVLSPFLLLNFKTSMRLKKFDEQLPDTLQLISGSLKAGYSFNQALSMVVDEAGPPISDEFKRVLGEIRMGLAEKDALENMAKKINSEHLNWAVMSINIQREVGGNLAEIMEIIADTIRERDRVMRQIKALTAEGRISAYILIGLPIFLAAILVILNRQYVSLLVTTKIGFAMLIMSVILMLIGVIWIMRVIRIDY